MPTVRPRHMITETDQLSRAIDLAASRWPEEHGERAALLRRIISEGIAALSAEEQNKSDQRTAAIKAVAGSLSGTWPQDWRTELAHEWPE